MNQGVLGTFNNELSSRVKLQLYLKLKAKLISKPILYD